jgi:Thioredoxin
MEKLFLITFVSLVVGLFPGREDFNMQEMVKVFSEMKDDVSVILDNLNYKNYLENNTYPWFIFFYQPGSQKSALANPPWIILGEKVRESEWPINIAKVDMSTADLVRKAFKVHRFPSFIYLDDKHAYDYQGSVEPDDLKRVYLEKTYLQYDRKPFDIFNQKPSGIIQAKKYFVENPAFFILSIFFATLFTLHIPNIYSRTISKKKTKSD